MDPAVITGLTAVATAGVGYLGARLQHAAERDRTNLERDRLTLELESARADARTADAQRLHEQSRQRRQLYLEYLHIAEEAWTLSMRLQSVSESDLDAWWATYQKARRELRIGSAESVVESMQELNDALILLFDDLVAAAREDDEAESHESRMEAWREHCPDIEAALRNLEEAMRDDLDVTTTA